MALGVHGAQASRLDGPAKRDVAPKEPCAICFEPIALLDADFLGCGHVFHKECMQEATESSSAPNCPMCRGWVGTTASIAKNIMCVIENGEPSTESVGFLIPLASHACAHTHTVRTRGECVLCIHRICVGLAALDEGAANRSGSTEATPLTVCRTALVSWQGKRGRSAAPE